MGRGNSEPRRSTSREKQRRYRARKREGKRELRLFVDLFQVSDALVERGFLGAWDSDDPKKILAAAEAFIRQLEQE